MDYVIIGKIINTFGIKGELKIASCTDFVKERFAKDSTVYVGEEYLPFTVNSCRSHKGFLLVSFKDHEDINLVEKYKNMFIYKAKKDIPPLKQGEYYFSDLRDLDVYVEGELVGKVLRVEEGIRNNNLRIRKEEDQKEYLVPFLEVFIENVDLEKKRIDIRKMEGLL
ncbi:MAG: 16S rRNA processing protein RimM [Oscillospiraceae bacterium]|nr:16S rRNA processing protein RimM [Oscillospiraceae bacterium]MBQ6493962.1 16S rRNA processing protein RimM [Erysipelotrichaceae bacterium]